MPLTTDRSHSRKGQGGVALEYWTSLDYGPGRAPQAVTARVKADRPSARLYTGHVLLTGKATPHAAKGYAIGDCCELAPPTCSDPQLAGQHELLLYALDPAGTGPSQRFLSSAEPALAVDRLDCLSVSATQRHRSLLGMAAGARTYRRVWLSALEEPDTPTLAKQRRCYRALGDH
ncbi:hypothetical protein GCM10020229_33920 [Kitasatospora albolonga]